MSQIPGHQHLLSLDLPAAHRGVRVARSIVKRFARLEGLDRREADSQAVVVSELLMNVIDHGSAEAAMTEDDLDHKVRMRFTLLIHDGGWQVSVSDQGGGDPDRVRRLLEAKQAPDLEDERGRGLYLLRQMVQRVEVRASPDGRGLTIIANRVYDAS
jgi:anti-sigma regulatory factor (Ser/Thr protein kinase)